MTSKGFTEFTGAAFPCEVYCIEKVGVGGIIMRPHEFDGIADGWRDAKQRCDVDWTGVPAAVKPRSCSGKQWRQLCRSTVDVKHEMDGEVIRLG